MTGLYTQVLTRPHTQVPKFTFDLIPWLPFSGLTLTKVLRYHLRPRSTLGSTYTYKAPMPLHAIYSVNALFTLLL